MAQLNEWLSIDKTSGEGNATVTLTASSYKELVDRTTSLRIQGVVTNSILTVKQNAFIHSLTLTTYNVEAESNGGRFDITITSNVPYTTIEGEGLREWCKISATQYGKVGLSNMTLIFNANIEPTDRVSFIKFVCGDEVLATLNIKQKGVDYQIEITPSAVFEYDWRGNGYAYDGYGNSVCEKPTVTFMSNIENLNYNYVNWGDENYDMWFGMERYEGVNKPFILRVDMNPNNQPREGYIQFIRKAGTTSNPIKVVVATITIRQGGNPFQNNIAYLMCNGQGFCYTKPHLGFASMQHYTKYQPNLHNSSAYSDYYSYATVGFIKDLYEIPDGSFNEMCKSKLLEITIPPIEVTKIGNDVLRGSSTNLLTTTFEGFDNVKEVGNNSFYLMDVRSFPLQNLQRIGNNSFQGCIIPFDLHLDNVISIGDNCFYSCNLSDNYPLKITLGASLQEIGSGFLSNTPPMSVEITTYATTAPIIKEDTFSGGVGIEPNGVLRYPQGADYSTWIAQLEPKGWTFETF